MTKKKTTAKTTAKAAPKTKGWDFLGNDNWASNAAEVMSEYKAKNKGSSVSELSKAEDLLLPIPEFGLQAAINAKGLKYGTIMDIIAPDGIGKTTLIMTALGWFMQQGSPCYYVETENKLMAADRIKRCLSTDRAMAEKLFNRLVWDQCFEIQSAVKSMEDFAIGCRKPGSAMYVPQHVPIVLALDTFSKLMSAGEAEDVVVHGEREVGKSKEVGGGVTMAAAQAAQSWMRRLPWFQKHYNAIFIFARHQNDKVDFSAAKFGGGSMSGGGDAFNRTSRGGRAFNQNAALQIILSRIGLVSAKFDGVDEKVGVNAQITVCKNSYGAEGKRFGYRINTVHRTDTETYQEPAITFAPATAEWAYMHKVLPGISMKNKNCYTCKDLKIYDASADEFHRALHADAGLLDMLGSRLGIRGYAASQELPAAPAEPAVVEEDKPEAEPKEEENAESQ